MGTILAGSLVTQAAQDLNDAAHSQWTENELLDYLNDGQRSAVLVKPNVNTKTETVSLVEGVKQTLPEKAYLLIDVTRNMPDGTAINAVERKTLDADKDWSLPSLANVRVRNFVYDIRDRRTFYVSPPQPDPPGTVEITYSLAPETITGSSGTITIDDIYAPALLAYIMHRARIKDMAVEGQGPQVSSLYFQKFMTLITGENTAYLIPTELTQSDNV